MLNSLGQRCVRPRRQGIVNLVSLTSGPSPGPPGTGNTPLPVPWPFLNPSLTLPRPFPDHSLTLSRCPRPPWESSNQTTNMRVFEQTGGVQNPLGGGAPMVWAPRVSRPPPQIYIYIYIYIYLYLLNYIFLAKNRGSGPRG